MKSHIRLKKVIDLIGLKQTIVAEKSGINYKTFNAILNGNRALQADELLGICEKGLGISIENFFKYEFQENGNKNTA